MFTDRNKIKFFTLLLVCYGFYGIIICSNLPTECGKNGLTFDYAIWKIVGGQKASLGEFPWQVFIQRESVQGGDTYIQMCGGSIINENWILTAAHCVHQAHTNELSLILGDYDLSVREGTEVVAAAEKIITKEDYDQQTLINDLALIKISGKLDFANKQKQLKPICLPKPTNEETTNCYVTGWGSVNNTDGSQSKILLKVKEPLYNITKCASLLPGIDLKLNVCAGGSSEGGFGACVGDSGGPLQCYGSDGRWYQHGVVSWGDPCAKPGVPDVFTRVSEYRTWIEEIINKS